MHGFFAIGVEGDHLNNASCSYALGSILQRKSDKTELSVHPC